MRQAGFTHEANSYDTPVEWYTPPSIFKALALDFDLDPASPGASVVPWIPAAKHYTIAEDGLKTPWMGRCWLNPPVCACNVQPVVIQYEHENTATDKTMSKVLEGLAVHGRTFSAQNGDVLFRVVVQELCQGVGARETEEAQSRSGAAQKAFTGEGALCSGRQGRCIQTQTIPDRQPQKATAANLGGVCVDTGSLAVMPSDVESHMRVLRDNRTADAGSFYTAILSALSGNRSGQHGSRLLEVQLLKGGVASCGMDEGQASICPHCGKAGFSRITRPRVFCNPPYGPQTPQWVSLFRKHGNGIMLLFARTDTGWFHDLAPVADALCFIKGRIKFIPSRPQQGNSGAGAGSVLVAMGDDCAEALKRCGLGYTFGRKAKAVKG